MKKILITGSAGFIGFHLTRRFLEKGYEVVGIDNVNEYYDPQLKYARLAENGILGQQKSQGEFSEINFNQEISSFIYPNYRFIRLDIVDKDSLFDLFAREKFDWVIHLAAQAGVRYSIENPDIYIQSNIIGFFNILEGCRHSSVRKLLYASSSSIYGDSSKVPFSVGDKTDLPVSLYAATKKSNELMAHVYSYLYQITTIGLRFFTVYGSWGRPDMSPMLFAHAIAKGNRLQVFNNGEMERDFTHVSDIVEGVFRLSQVDFTADSHFQIFNIGNGNPVKLLDFINKIECAMNQVADIQFLPMQPGDVQKTWADTEELARRCDFRPRVSLDEGIEEFILWYRKYFGIQIRKNAITHNS